MPVFNAYAKYYDLLYKDKDYNEEACYIINLIKKHKPGARKILDLGSGTGKHCINFAKEGFDVTGVELSEVMHDSAVKSLQNLKMPVLKLKFLKGDMRNVRISEEFDVITSLFHVINYQILNQDLRLTLKTVRHHLKEDGKFICDLWYGPAVLSERPEIRLKKIEDSEYKVERKAIPELFVNENTVNVNYKITVKEFNTGKTEEIEETHRMRYLFLPEIELLLDEAEMKIEQYEEWLTGKELSDKSWYALLIIGKK